VWKGVWTINEPFGETRHLTVRNHDLCNRHLFMHV
jgi:hypothetical protein